MVYLVGLASLMRRSGSAPKCHVLLGQVAACLCRSVNARLERSHFRAVGSLHVGGIGSFVFPRPN